MMLGTCIVPTIVRITTLRTIVKCAWYMYRTQCMYNNTYVNILLDLRVDRDRSAGWNVFIALSLCLGTLFEYVTLDGSISLLLI